MQLRWHKKWRTVQFLGQVVILKKYSEDFALKHYRD